MNLPNLKEAKKRDEKEVLYINQQLSGNNSFAGKKYFLRTYGCQMNEHDSEEIEGILEYLGMTPTEEMEKALTKVSKSKVYTPIENNLVKNAIKKSSGVIIRLYSSPSSSSIGALSK